MIATIVIEWKDDAQRFGGVRTKAKATVRHLRARVVIARAKADAARAYVGVDHGEAANLAVHSIALVELVWRRPGTFP